MANVCVLIPGIMGSELSLNGQRIWPGPLLDLRLPYRHMADLLSPDLVATVVADVDVNYVALAQVGDRDGLLDQPVAAAPSNHRSQAATGRLGYSCSLPRGRR